MISCNKRVSCLCSMKFSKSSTVYDATASYSRGENRVWFTSFWNERFALYGVNIALYVNLRVSMHSCRAMNFPTMFAVDIWLLDLERRRQEPSLDPTSLSLK